jgi:hypothetical protein
MGMPDEDRSLDITLTGEGGPRTRDSFGLDSVWDPDPESDNDSDSGEGSACPEDAGLLGDGIPSFNGVSKVV